MDLANGTKAQEPLPARSVRDIKISCWELIHYKDRQIAPIFQLMTSMSWSKRRNIVCSWNPEPIQCSFWTLQSTEISKAALEPSSANVMRISMNMSKHNKQWNNSKPLQISLFIQEAWEVDGLFVLHSSTCYHVNLYIWHCCCCSNTL